MAVKKHLLVLRLEGVLQAWGEMSKWDFRDSGSMPTKSGVVGLLGCALGEPRDSDVLIELARSIQVAVRADRSGEIRADYQTVTGAPLYNAEGKPRKMNGKPADTFVSKREYLHDACFTVFLETTDEWRERLVHALQDPKWCMYLGRKSCVPSRPILECADAVYPDLMEALKSYPTALRRDREMKYEMEQTDLDGNSLLRSDDLVGTGRQFGLRRVCRGVIREVEHVSD